MACFFQGGIVMSIIVFIKEQLENKHQCSLLTAKVKAYTQLGATALVEFGNGTRISSTVSDCLEAGLTVANDRVTIRRKPILNCPLIRLLKAI